MLLVNSVGRVVDITDPALIAEYLEGGRMREATAGEAESYRQRMDLRQMESDAATVRPDNQVYFSTVAGSSDGYGMSRDLLKRELAAIGTHLFEQYDGQKVGLLYSYPDAVTRMQSPVRLVYTMFESSKIPDEWPDLLREADEVLVPSRWCQEVFKRSGIESTVVPLGYNDRVFKYIDRPVPVEHHEPFVFLHYNSLNERKGFIEVFNAFTQEFAQNEPVKLVLKTVYQHSPIPILPDQYPNIEVIYGDVSETELTNILGGANCMVYPSRGEGFGITPLEAMATGLATIVPNEHGISEYFNADYMLEVKAPGRCPGLYNRFRGQDVGEMVIADVDDLRKQMRHAYNHQAQMKALGLKASEYVKQWTYKKSAEKLKVVLQKWQVNSVTKRPDSKFLRVIEV